MYVPWCFVMDWDDDAGLSFPSLWASRWVKGLLVLAMLAFAPRLSMLDDPTTCSGASSWALLSLGAVAPCVDEAALRVLDFACFGDCVRSVVF